VLLLTVLYLRNKAVIKGHAAANTLARIPRAPVQPGHQAADVILGRSWSNLRSDSTVFSVVEIAQKDGLAFEKDMISAPLWLSNCGSQMQKADVRHAWCSIAEQAASAHSPPAPLWPLGLKENVSSCIHTENMHR